MSAEGIIMEAKASICVIQHYGWVRQDENWASWEDNSLLVVVA